MESPPAIVCRNVTKKFDDLIAVDSLSLELPSGICALVGPNGAGKSTFLNMLTGLIPPDEGDIRICGVALADTRKLIGVMPEKSGLFDLLSIREHFELVGDVYGLSKSEASSRAQELVGVLGLDSIQDLFCRPMLPRNAEKDLAGSGFAARASSALSQRKTKSKTSLVVNLHG